MAGITDLLNSDLGRQIIGGVSSEAGTSEQDTTSVLGMALPILTGAMQKNASSPEGAASLLGALSGDKHSGGVLDNLGGFFGGGVNQEDEADGAGILGHILGGKQSTVENAISRKSGINSGTVSKIIKIAAPILMGYLGKQARQQNVNSADGVSGLLSSLMGSQANKNQSLVTSLLDSDGDGSVIDDIAGMALGNKEGGGGLLGGLFGK
ncbi:DUF937 domain-containing protein [Sinomicrobium weinanense]|uniref:DUF937 domain-containing protein n=1 Tax=Sinomicrobium weinanense TaxID=2842200 RepID=A0A926JT67_9FLAO|nr:DUF937 domain-containing protein [Sinomicrobium weinanense]MBC9797072.1 DUF937 domain-containing protein [Sinomicrobium weinanense]MBU3122699.1 DUF937 domain-containing protein [Sinomicrobium weinanense]